jgi:uncharacterized protein (TIGR01777 family)
MNILIAGGTGFIGEALIAHLLSSSENFYAITLLTRNTNKAQAVFKKYDLLKLRYLTWQELENKPDDIVNIIAGFDVIINLCGMSIGEQRWTEAVKNQIIDSRVKPTQLLAKACADVAMQYHKIIGLYNASAVGIYSSIHPQKIYTEDSYINNPVDFLSTVGFAWERAALEAVNHNVRVVYLRFGVVLARHGGALKKMLLPFKLGLGSVIGNGQQPFPWIYLEDLVRAIEQLILNTKIHGPINLVAPELVTQQQFAHKLAKSLHRPCFMRLPEFVVKMLFGEMGQELLLGGQKVKSYKLNLYYKDWLCPNLDKVFGI